MRGQQVQEGLKDVQATATGRHFQEDRSEGQGPVKEKSLGHLTKREESSVARTKKAVSMQRQ